MRRIGMATRDELVAAVSARYASGTRMERARILDEFTAVSGHHRKHATQLLRAGLASRPASPHPERRVYDEAVRQALIVIWEAWDGICGSQLGANSDEAARVYRTCSAHRSNLMPPTNPI
jgi:hypothetical protein